MCRKRTLIAFALSLLVVCGAPSPAKAGPRDFIIYVTRLGGDPDAAKPYIAKFLVYLEEAIGWPKGSSRGTFTTSHKDALAAIESAQPGFGVVEPALYLELRTSKDLIPIVEVVSKDLVSQHLHLLVANPAYRVFSDLKGKKLWTMAASSPAYLSKIVFDGKVDAAAHFELKQIGSAMKGVRAVLRGEADATLLDDEQMELARKMEGGGKLRSIHDSQMLPPLLVVTFGKSFKPEERKKLAKVLLEMCGTAQGGEVCKEMHITRFAPLRSAAVLAAHKRYEQK